MAAIDGLHLPVATFDAVSMNIDVAGQYAQQMWLVRGLNELWNVRGIDTVIPATAGRTARNRIRDWLDIELSGFIIGEGSTPSAQINNARSRLTSLTSNFDPTGIGTLVIDLEDGDTATIADVRPLNILMLDYPDPVFRPFSIQLEAIGTDWVIA